MAAPQRIDELAALADGRDPDAPALVEGRRSLTYRALAAAVEEAAAFVRTLGVRPGDRVLIVNENCIAALVLALAAARCDAWPAPVNARLTTREFDAIRAHCVPRRIFFTTAVSSDAAAHAKRAGGTRARSPGIGEIAVAPIDANAVPEATQADPARQVAALIYTSGTTGAPKGVMLSHASLLFAAATGKALRRLAPGDRVYAALPISHVFGFASVSLSALAAGATLHLVPRFSAEHLARAIGHDAISVLPGVPAMYVRLLEHLRGAKLPAPRLRFLYAGGAPLDAQLKADVETLFHQPLHNGYGLTETAPTVSSTRIDAPRGDLSVGPPAPGVAARIVASDRRVASAGEIGELHVRGPNVMLGYYRDAVQTAAVLAADGWLNTGDLAYADTDGNLFIVGRSKELIIHSGFNVYPVEVESVLNRHPAVGQCAVVGRCVRGNEEVVAFVELRAGETVSGETLREYAAQHLAPYKRPAEVIVLPALPATSTGKILKGALRSMAAAQTA